MGLYNEDHELFRRSFKKFIDSELAPYYEEWDDAREVPLSIWKKFGDHGYLCPWLDERYGGAGTDFLYSVIIRDELAKAGLALDDIGTHCDIVAPYINSYGKEEQKTKWLPGCATGEILLAVAMTEPDTGSDLGNIKTTAVRDGNEYVINGSKTFITNGYNASLVVVACKTNPKAVPGSKGLSLILVESGTPGFSKGRKLDKMGVHCAATAELFFENCRVPVENLLGRENEGFKYLMEKLQQERLCSAINSQGLSERILADAMEYAKTRKVFGQAVGKFQHNAFKIAEMATEVQIGRVFLDSLIEEHIAGKDIVTKVSMAKYWISEMLNRVAYNGLQLYGGYGYMEEYPIARHYRDARVHTIYAGTSEIMKMIISRRLGF